MNSCTICMKEDIIDEDIYTTDCNHIFCKNCIQTHIKKSNKCPICNKENFTYKKSKEFKQIIKKTSYIRFKKN